MATKIKHHPEAKGLLFIALSVLLFAMLFTFIEGDLSQNALGFVGYYIAFGFYYLFGFGSYLVSSLITWCGFDLLIFRRISSKVLRFVYFSLVLLSSCILLNVFAELSKSLSPTLMKRCYSEVVTIGLHHKARFNLGGVPAYYLLSDLKQFNLTSLLSIVGTTITFSVVGLVSFILLTGIRILVILRAILYALKGIMKGAQSLFLLVKRIFPKAYRDEFSAKDLMESEENTFETYEEPEIEIAEPKKRKRKPRTFALNDEEEVAPKKRFRKQLYRGEFSKYTLPPLSLLTNAKKTDHPTVKKDLRRLAEILEETLYSFGIEAKVGDINYGPTITSFEVLPAIGVKVQKIKALEKDIALNLQAKSIRIIAPIPGKAAVGVEIPSLNPQEVGFKEMLAQYKKNKLSLNIPVLLGKTVSGEDVMCDLTKMPHCIIAGATGSGKSVCINTIIMSILMNARPDEIKLIMIDPKKVELTPYSPLPHMLAPVITEAHGAYAALSWALKEMQNRYDILKHLGLRNITAFNQRKIDEEFESSLGIEIPPQMPWIVMIIDEFADLMMSSSTDLETPIARIAQMARAVGIHLILATQRPSREVITGLIKANFPTRISFKVSSRINSQIILDENGAETLLGNGDMLFLPPGTSQLLRSQGVFIRDEDINQVINYICSQASADYLIKSFDTMSHEDLFPEQAGAPKDALYNQALTLVVETKNASTTFLQRKLKIGYARAASLMDELEDHGVIGPQEGSRPRKVLYTGRQ